MELLAPAGSKESLVAAVQNGADAVYLGGGKYNARRFADNFSSDSEMIEAISYAHARGVKVHVTMNTLLFDRELKGALQYAEFLYEQGVDALIVQDIGFAGILKQELPDFSLHASTQMAIHSADGAMLAKSMGFFRIVLARELHIDEVKRIYDSSKMDIECFAQGALCTAVSGLCLFSSLSGGRSGNRGDCAQPCRKSFNCINGEHKKNGYPLSLSDLSMLFHVKRLEDSGVMSIKLEGRMKRAEYVAAVVQAYRSAIDGADEATLLDANDRINRVFSRNDGTTGYYFDSSAVRPNAIGKRGDDAKLLTALKDSYKNDIRKNPLFANITMNEKEYAQLTVTALGVSVSEVSDEKLEAAKNPPDKERIKAQVGKLGDTPFTLESCDVIMEKPAFMAASSINALRRDAIASLTKKLQGVRETKNVSVPDLPLCCNSPKTDIVVIAPSVSIANAAFDAGASAVALQPCSYGDRCVSDLASLQEKRGNAKLLLALPAVIADESMRRDVQSVLHCGLIDGALANHASAIHAISHLEIRMLSYLSNVTNAHTINEYKKLGFTDVTLSLELRDAQMRDLILHDVGVYAFGRVDMMQLLHCPIKFAHKCRDCMGDAGVLVDEVGRTFPLKNTRDEHRCLLRVKNTDVLDLFDVLPEIESKPRFVIIEAENERDVKEAIDSARKYLSGERPMMHGTTRGHFKRGLKKFDD